MRADKEGGFGTGVAGVEVVEDFGCALAGADDGDVVGFCVVGEDGFDVPGVLGGVDDARGVGGDAGGEEGFAADGYDEVFSFVGGGFEGGLVGGNDFPGGDGGIDFGPDGEHGDDVFGVLNLGVEVGGTPGHIVVILLAEWEEGSEVEEAGESALLVEIVDEGEFGLWVAHGG